MSKIKIVQSRIDSWRDDGAYTTYWHKEGNINYFHREDGPALERFDKDDNLLTIGYYLNGQLHREDGPAWTYYNSDGTTTQKFYYLNGCKMSKEEWTLRLDPLYKELV